MNELINNDLLTVIENMQLPPTLYSLMNSIANFGTDEDERVNTYNLSKVARANIFDFDYELTENLTKEEFETMILDHFIMRRIGFETLTMFKIQLKNKIKTIMPLYNKLFDSLDGWDLFNDGETITTSMENDSKTAFSDTPQNHIENIDNTSYITDYTHNESDGSSTSERTIGDKMSLYKEFITYKQNVFDLIFNDLECLFYGLY